MSWNAGKFNSVDRSKWEYRKAYGGNKFGPKTPWIQPNFFPEGATFSLRQLPSHPSRCPDGFYITCEHSLAEKIGERGTKFNCLIPLGKECAACDILEAATEYRLTLTETTQGALDLLAVQERMLIPCVGDIMGDPAWKKTEESPYQPYIKAPDGKRRLFIFTIANQNKLRQRIIELNQLDPMLNDQFQGKDLIFKRPAKNQYDIDPMPDRSELRERDQMDDNNYPRFASMFKSTHNWTYAEMWDRIRNAYWWPGMAHLGLSLADDDMSALPY